MARSLQSKTLFISGASRGIGRAIALRAARDGANVAVIGKTSIPNPKLPGTVHDVVAEINAAGGKGLACICDIRFEDQVLAAVAQTIATFGGIDILVNNASAISLTRTLDTDMKRFDLMHQINTRGTFLCSKACLPALLRAPNPHILMLAPPPALQPQWFAPHLAYTIAKYGMSLCVLGLAAEFKDAGVAVNALWPRTVIATAAVQNLLGGDATTARARRPEIVADAAHIIFTRASRDFTGQFFIDEDVLRSEGVTNFDTYADVPDRDLLPDLFL
ncbi:MAG: NAD(P)-dependent oxidoreductase [Deltaproteobacteria bacterium]|nr:NAD(P)-dependent oxidoreductase [Deltaproteobacteria bacterium]